MYGGGIEEPYEKVYLLPYESNCKAIEIKDKNHYDTSISNIYAGGGTHFYNSFLEMQNVIT